ncbi:MAG TPA: glycosyltransferase [Verrucomicrobiae bacterium]|nr:glycosyltransferase [Verrucomicrobiae bacterium]
MKTARFSFAFRQPARYPLRVNQGSPSVLLLIPAYNEERRIEPALREFATYFRANYAGKFRVVVVLNGCVDNTLAVVRRVAREFNEIGWLDFPGRIGKGGALIEGLKLAPHADLIGYVDADGATGPKAFHDLLKRAGEADCIIGSRWLPGAVLLQSQTWLRRFVSRCFHAVVQVAFWMNIQDTQCPAKIVRREAIEKIYDRLRIADLAFDVNLLVALKHAGFTILEVPTEWTDKVGTKVTQTLVRSSLVMFLSVVRLRLIYSPFYSWLRPLRPLEKWVYMKLNAPPPRPAGEIPDAARPPGELP